MTAAVAKCASILVCLVLLAVQAMCSCAIGGVRAVGPVAERPKAASHACCAAREESRPHQPAPQCPHCQGTAQLNLVSPGAPTEVDVPVAVVLPVPLAWGVETALIVVAGERCGWQATHRLGESPPVRQMCCTYLI
jgi:hypothetical protein